MLQKTLEIWSTIDNYPDYKISTLGNVRSKGRVIEKTSKKGNKYSTPVEPKVLHKNNDKDGYHMVNLYINKKMNTYRVHRLVAKTFLPNPENKPYVNHKDGIKTHNSVGNLEWVTQSENEKHAYSIGLKDQHGEKNHGHKLKAVDILEIFKLFNVDKLTPREIYTKFNIAQQTLSKILLRKSWKHIKIPKEYMR